MSKIKSTKTEDKQQDLARSVMQSIQKEEVTMHSRWYFLGLSAISVISVFLTSVFAAILINLTIRDIQYADDRGLIDLAEESEWLMAFPWLLLIFTVIAVFSTVTLARKLEFAYKFRSYMFFGGSLGLVIALGLGISMLGISEHIEDTDPFRPLQTLKSRVDTSIVTGEVIEVTEDYVLLETIDENQIKVFTSEKTVYRPGQPEIEVGQEIGVFGEKLKDGTWQAFRIGDKPPGTLNKPRVKGLKDRRYVQPNIEAPAQ